MGRSLRDAEFTVRNVVPVHEHTPMSSDIPDMRMCCWVCRRNLVTYRVKNVIARSYVFCGPRPSGGHRPLHAFLTVGSEIAQDGSKCGCNRSFAFTWEVSVLNERLCGSPSG
jgi:hypothetical protein